MGKNHGAKRHQHANLGKLLSSCWGSRPEKRHKRNDCAVSGRGEGRARGITQKKKGHVALGEKPGAKHRDLEQNFQLTGGKKKALLPFKKHVSHPLGL